MLQTQFGNCKYGLLRKKHPQPQRHQHARVDFQFLYWGYVPVSLPALGKYEAVAILYFTCP